MMNDIKVPYHCGFASMVFWILLSLCVCLCKKLTKVVSLGVPASYLWVPPQKEILKGCRLAFFSFFLSFLKVSDWQLVLFEVCLCMCVFEVGIEERQWHLSCSVNIWRGSKQSDIPAKAGDDRAVWRMCHRQGVRFPLTVTVSPIS